MMRGTRVDNEDDDEESVSKPVTYATRYDTWALVCRDTVRKLYTTDKRVRKERRNNGTLDILSQRMKMTTDQLSTKHVRQEPTR
jgi:hypothetical protein